LIFGIGIDIIEVSRIERCLRCHTKFLERCFSEEELRVLKRNKNMAVSAAGRFAAKEAVLKAIGTGLRQMKLKDIVIDKDELGKPVVILKNGAMKAANSRGITKIHISISHTDSFATACAYAETARTT
jgi:holo-[acyl-carrier protein] synthase